MINQTTEWKDVTTEYTKICETVYEEWRQEVVESNKLI
jgi:hypothetical protein